ncbi:MAG: response regulator [Gemmatimonadaceae bacterium]|nr:response regulator [Gemmatimonadaceae bacterium]
MTHVLIVDDKAENLYYLRALLTGSGFTVEEARHGAEALVVARSHPPDVIISDLLMPVMDGYTLLRYWKADRQLQRIPFVVYTATYTEEKDARLARDLGADAFILKPCEPDELLAHIREVLARGTAASGADAGSSGAARSDGRSDEIMQVYSEALIRKLEEKSLQLEDANKRLSRASLLLEIAGQVTRMGGWWLEVGASHVVWSAETCRIHGEPEGTAPDIERAINYYEEHRSRPVIRAAVERCLADGTPFDLELELHSRTGARVSVRAIGEAVRDDHGRISRVQGALQDVSERRAADRRLAQQAALLDKAQDAILVHDLDDTIRYWNRSAERLYGWSAAEAIGRSAHQLIHDDSSEYAEARAALLARGEWIGSLRQVARDGRRVVTECRWTLVRSDDGEPPSILAINTDVSERRNLELQFLRAQRLESIGTLAGGIAHDLNNVLAPVMLSLNLLRELAGPEGADLVDSLRQSVGRGADLVRHVLTFARGLDGKREPLDLRTVANELESVVRDTFPKNIALTFALDEAPCLLRGDATQLHQVIMNLAVNARDAMADGGTLRIAVDHKTVESSPVSSALGLSPGRYVRLVVRDTGDGIAPEHQVVIFEPFFTTKGVGKGTGLGLSTVQSIVRGHGGIIELESETGRGTTFTCWFPEVSADTDRQDARPADRRMPEGKGECILVVDDEDGIRAVANRILQRNGYRVLLAANGREGLQLYHEHSDTIDAVVTDVAMPELDGPGLIAALRAEGIDVPIIVSSGHAIDAGGLLKSGTEFFISKPFTAETLLATLKGALVGRR